MRPTPSRGAMIKVRGIFEIAGRDKEFSRALANDPRGTISLAGLDFSEQEILAVEDILRGTSNSAYSKPPDGQESKYPELREMWKAAAPCKAP